MFEIERKFLVKSNAYKAKATEAKKIVQGYLSKDPARTVRVRIMNDQAFLTIKGESDAQGLVRFEWEKEITIDDAKNLLKCALPTVIEKTRYFVPHGKYCIEVDVFKGKHAGLVLCEIELNTPEEKIEMPVWVGEEVTGNPDYYNSALSSAK